MPEFSLSIVVDRPAAAVFAYVADISRWPEWRMALTDAQLTTPGPTSVGTRATLSGTAMGRSLDAEVEVVGFAANEAIDFELRSGIMSGNAVFRFEAFGQSTRLTVSGTVQPPGVLKLASAMVARQAQAMWSDDLAALKAILEG